MNYNNQKRASVAIIFAGGKSSRMGEDKALLPFGEYNSLAEYQYQRLSKIFKAVYISSKYDKFDFEVNVIEDKYRESSPLVALVSIFETLEEIEEVFVLSVDTPFIEREEIEELYSQADRRFAVTVANSKRGIEPLCGIYQQAILKEAKKMLAENNHRLYSLLERVGFQKVNIENENSFMNLNYFNEYEEALRIEKN